jgi:hypothetical protein
MLPKAALLALLAVLSLPALAHAGTLYAQQDFEFRYIAAPGERNRVTITEDQQFPDPSTAYTILHLTDVGAPIRLGRVDAECTFADEHHVTCRMGGGSVLPVRVEGGDLDDQVTVADDTPTTEPEGLFGGGGSDVLMGGSRADELTGGDGPDRLLGRDGDDFISMGRDDRTDAGRGSDTVFLEPSADEAGTALCGIGRDVVARDARAPRRVGAGTFLAGDCEGQDVIVGTKDRGAEEINDIHASTPVHPRRSTRSGRVVLGGLCSEIDCSGRVAITSPRGRFRTLASRRYRGRLRVRGHGEPVLLSLRLPASTARAARRRATLLRVVISGASRRPVVWRMRLRLP